MTLAAEGALGRQRTWPTKGGTRVSGATAQPRVVVAFGQIRVQKLITPVCDLERWWIEIVTDWPERLGVACRQIPRPIFLSRLQVTRPLRLRHPIPLDRDAAPMPVARARAGSQFHRRSWQPARRQHQALDDRYQPHAPPQMQDDGAARSRRRASRLRHRDPVCLKRVEQIASEDEPLPLPPRKAFAYEMIYPAFHRISCCDTKSSAADLRHLRQSTVGRSRSLPAP